MPTKSYQDHESINSHVQETLETIIRQFSPRNELKILSTSSDHKGTTRVYTMHIPKSKLRMHVKLTTQHKHPSKKITITVGLPTNHGLKRVGKESYIRLTPSWNVRLQRKICNYFDNIPQYHVCPQCQCPLTIRKRKHQFGTTPAENQPYFACTNFPKCGYTSNIDKQGNPITSVPISQTMTVGKKIVKITRVCPKCTGSLEERKGKNGVYHCCTAWPKCRYVEKISKLPTEKEVKRGQLKETSSPVCSKCGKRMVQRDGKYGTFWGCKGYPRCKGTRNL